MKQILTNPNTSFAFTAIHLIKAPQKCPEHGFKINLETEITEIMPDSRKTATLCIILMYTDFGNTWLHTFTFLP